MAPRRESLREKLQAHDIYLRNQNALDLCPAELRNLFKLMEKVQDLRSDHFGGFESAMPSHELAIFGPRQRYEKRLKSEAYYLSADCADGRRKDDIANRWMLLFESTVFCNFKRKQEEKYKRARHHTCSICRDHFPAEIQPMSIPTSEQSIEQRLVKWSADREEDLCPLMSKKHFNLPNFDTAHWLAYLKFEDKEDEKKKKKKKIPDLTIGLCSSNLVEWPGTTELVQKHNDRIRLYDQQILIQLHDNGYLTPQFVDFGTSGKRADDMSLTYPFAFWQAKREGGRHDHQSAQKQNALKVKMMLEWQDKVGKRAGVPWVPLVFHFISVGSEFELYGCHFQQKAAATGGRICAFIKLWSGDCVFVDEALQLLYLVDIIALWGEYTYKPFARACSSHLHIKSEKIDQPPQTVPVPPFEIFSLSEGSEQIDSERRHIKPPQLLQIIPFSPSPSLPPPTSQAEYIIPERDLFIWVLDREPAKGDLLIIRIDEKGTLLPPLIIFSNAKWDNFDFRRVIKEERARLPDNILMDFKTTTKGKSYITKCAGHKSGYFRQPRVQFCAIIPLDFKTYRRQKYGSSSDDEVFEDFEDLLDLPELIETAEEENDKWCICEAPYTKRSPAMILCDNAKCPVGWYHKRCENLPERFERDFWLCKKCVRKWRCGDEERVGLQNWDIDDQKILKASDTRVQRAKMLAKVWREHRWPSKERVLRLIDRTSCRVDVGGEDREYCPTLDAYSRDGERSWALLRSDPKLMVAVRPIKDDDQDVLKTTSIAQRLKRRKSERGLSTNNGR